MTSARTLLILAALLTACSPDPPPVDKPEPPAIHPSETALARTYLDANRPDLALAVLAVDPTQADVRALLDEKSWHLPATFLDHPGCEIQHIALHGASLWVGVASGPFHTIVRWNLESLEIEAVLLPSRAPLKSMVLSPTASHAIISRGEVTLLVDAQSLRPITALGMLPDNLTPASTVAFSPDSLLVAHPDADGWHIRDTATGQAIRHVAPDELPPAPVLAARLDTRRLRLLANDGTRIDIPVSPIESIETTPFDEEEIEILHAHLLASGHAALIVLNLGPHAPPAVVEFHLTDTPSAAPFDLDAWATRQTHGPLPGLAGGLLRHLDPPPVALTESLVRFHGGRMPPLPTTAPPIAFAADVASPALAVAEAAGRIILHRPIDVPAHPDAVTLAAIAGHQYDPETATLTAIPIETRRAALAMDPVRTTNTDHLLPLWHRLADALPPGSPAPESIPDLSLTPSPTDHAPAHVLAHALLQEDPAAIASILESSTNLPPTLETLAISHIRQRSGNTAAAFQPYLDGFPDLSATRLREDWRGWEQADFQPAVDAIASAYRAAIDALTIDPDADESTRLETFARLTDPEAPNTLGRSRYATACLDAATVLATLPDETEAVFTLANLARHHGAPPVPCLRAEAHALTTLESYADAHTRWIELITEHPVDTHLPNDYAEAAYTAFETADSRQALEILITGMARFEGDAEFALRAGWIALLTDHPDHARAFLMRARDAGIPEDKVEHATALLTVSAVLVFDSVAATAHFQDLLAIDPAWAEPETVEALTWPDHLKAPLRQLTW